VLAAAAAVALAVAPAGGQTTPGPSLAAFDEVWETINDSYYDPAFNGLDWAGVRAELRPRVERAATPDEARVVITEMLARLGQSHFVLLTSSAVGQPLPGSAMVPIDVRVTADGVVVTRVEPPASDRVQPGDLLIRIEGREPARATGLTERARRLVRWRDAFRLLHGPAGTQARLTLRGIEGRERTVDVARVEKAGDVVTLGNLPELRVRLDARDVRTPGGQPVGVIAFNAWMAAIAGRFAEAVDTFRAHRGIIIDLRGNAGGLADMMRGVAGHFLAEPALLGRLQMRGTALEFRANPRRSTSDGRRVEPFSGPLVILVDEQTASASECFAGAMQSLGRARIIGAQTMGQALPASTRVLSNGDVLMYAVGDFTTSTGRRLEGAGVVPDEIVPLSRRALAAGDDEPLTRALAWIDRQGPPALRSRSAASE
jgi:carboxyl-terminal processing protease